MRELLGRPWAVTRLRAVALLLLALAAVADLTTYVVLVARDAPPGPAEVARTVVQAVADDDCSGLGDLLAARADLPSPVSACLRGQAGRVPLSGVHVIGTATTGDASAVTIGLSVSGATSEVVVALRRTDRWRVTAIRTAS